MASPSRRLAMSSSAASPSPPTLTARPARVAAGSRTASWPGWRPARLPRRRAPDPARRRGAAAARAAVVRARAPSRASGFRTSMPTSSAARSSAPTGRRASRSSSATRAAGPDTAYRCGSTGFQRTRPGPWTSSWRRSRVPDLSSCPTRRRPSGTATSCFYRSCCRRSRPTPPARSSSRSRPRTGTHCERGPIRRWCRCPPRAPGRGRRRTEPPRSRRRWRTASAACSTTPSTRPWAT